MRNTDNKPVVTEQELIEGLLDFIIAAADFAKKAYQYAKNRPATESQGDNHE